MDNKVINIPTIVPILLFLVTVIIMVIASRRLSNAGIDIDIILENSQSRSTLIRMAKLLAITLLIYVSLVGALQRTIDEYGLYFAIPLFVMAITQIIVNIVVLRFGILGVITTIMWTLLGPTFFIYSYVLTKKIGAPLIMSSGFILICFSYFSWFLGNILKK